MALDTVAWDSVSSAAARGEGAAFRHLGENSPGFQIGESFHHRIRFRRWIPILTIKLQDSALIMSKMETMQFHISR
ncbi:hypothetical protein JOS77_04685 [Chromobacterium haemolyticum]|nr:hypothetical protein JOS77_04685 [Chromobacterium haemolyticum]